MAQPLFSSRDTLQHPLFIRVLDEYLSTIFSNVANKYRLLSAKGGSGDNFQVERLKTSIINSNDLPYHMHILRGLIPTLVFMEKDSQITWYVNDEEAFVTYLKVFCLGFTFHDINKLLGSEEINLYEGTNQYAEKIIEELEVQEFLTSWREHLSDIQFIMLSSEKRNKAFAQKFKKSNRLISELAKYCQLADTFSSKASLRSVADLHKQLANTKAYYKKIDSQVNISFIGVQSGIFVLVSRTLLHVIQDYLLDSREEAILFYMQDGFIFLGEPFKEEEKALIAQRFCDRILKSNDPATQTKIDYQSCIFGFTDSTPLTSDILEEIMEKAFGDVKYDNMDFFHWVKEAKIPDTEESKAVIKFLEETKLPYVPKLIASPGTSPYIIYLLEKDAWEDEDEIKPLLLRLFALIRIRYLSARKHKAWHEEITEVYKEHPYFFYASQDAEWLVNQAKEPDKFKEGKKKLQFRFPSSHNNVLFASMLKLKMLLGKGKPQEDELEEMIEKYKNEICNVWQNPKSEGAENQQALFQFAKLNLLGNFPINFNELFSKEYSLGDLENTCFFSGASAKMKYGVANAHGLTALNFSNRAKKTFKSKHNKMSALTSYELALRKKHQSNISPSGKVKGKVNTMVFVDPADYSIPISKDLLIKSVVDTKKGVSLSSNGQSLEIDGRSYTHNVEGFYFEEIEQSIKGHYYFILDAIRFIKETAFRVFATNLSSCYEMHRETFVFDHCLPLYQELGWNRVRLDEVEDRLCEISFFLEVLGKNNLVNHLTTYAKNPTSVFTAWNKLSSSKQRRQSLRFHYLIHHIFKRFKSSFSMNIIQKLAQLSYEVSAPDSKTESNSKLGWMFQEAIDTLQHSIQRQYGRQDTIGYICGAVSRKDPKHLHHIMDFASFFYDEVYVKHWEKKITPQTISLARSTFIYFIKEERNVQLRNNFIQKAMDALQQSSQKVSEDSIIEWLQNDKDCKKSAVPFEGDYRWAYKVLNSRETIVLPN